MTVVRPLTSIRLQRALRLGSTQDLGAIRVSAKPTLLREEPGSALLGDILAAKLDERAQFDAVREWVRRALRSAKLRDSLDDDRRNVLLRRRLAGVSRSARAKRTRRVNDGPIHLVTKALGRRASSTCAPPHHPTKRETP